MNGSQAPTFDVSPVIDDDSTARDGLDLASAAGIELLPWQADQVTRALGLRSDGEWSATRVGCAVPRQNGKGVVLEAIVLAKALLLGERVIWTAHEVRTMQDAFARFRAVLEASTDFSAHVKSIRAANGQERIQFHNGAEVKFSARSKSATRGLGFRTIICDEAQELDYLTMGAMLPTLSGQGAARTQVILTGTPPYSNKGEYFTDMRAAAYAGGDERLSWAEWAASRDDRPDDRDVWAKTNPSLGGPVRESKIMDEFKALAARPDVFRRERLGEWGRSGERVLALDQGSWGDGSVPPERWAQRDDAYTFRDGPLRVLAVDCTYNATMTTVVEVDPLADGTYGFKIIDAAPGLEWIVDTLEAVRSETPRVMVAFDPLRTGDLSPDLQRAGIRDSAKRNRIVGASGRDLTLACDGLVRAVREGRVLHDDPRLDAAANGATRSTFDDGKGWKLVGIDDTDVSPLIAAALALRTLQTVAPKRLQGRQTARIL